VEKIGEFGGTGNAWENPGYQGTTTTTKQPFYGPFSGTTQVSQYQKKHSPTHTCTDHQPSFISFFHLL